MTFAQLVNQTLLPLGNQVIVLLYAFSFFVFIAGVFRFMFTQGPSGREKGKQFMLWGVIGLAVLFGVWGLVNLALSTLTSIPS